LPQTPKDARIKEASKIGTAVCMLFISTFWLSTFGANAEQTQSAIADESWLDDWHKALENSMNDTAKSLDAFFALAGDESHEDATASGRIRLGWEPRTRDLAEFDVRFRVRVKLPALQNRVDLLLSDDEDDLQETSVKASRNDQLGRRDQATLAFRFRRTPDAKLSHRIGAGRRDQLFVKSRYRDGYQVNANETWFYDAELYYYTKDRLGGELGLTYQNVLSDDKLWRFSNRYFYRDNTNDWRWRHELQYLHQYDQNMAAIYTLFIEGLTRPNTFTEQIFLSARWRANPLRGWLFFELEPFILFLKEESFSPSYGIAMRFEVFYGKR
jgi:hypothetical protein